VKSLVTTSDGGFFEVSPKNIVTLFTVAHSDASFMDLHRGQKLQEVRLGVLDKTQSDGVKIIKEFKSDYLYPVVVGFVLNDKKKEFYNIYKTSSGVDILVSVDFFEGWQP
jgi:hypothetical protein